MTSVDFCDYTKNKPANKHRHLLQLFPAMVQEEVATVLIPGPLLKAPNDNESVLVIIGCY